jgi:hypothetical protein
MIASVVVSAALVAALLWPAVEDDPLTAYGDPLTNGQYSESLGRECSVVFYCPGSPPRSAKMSGILTGEYAEKIVLDTRNGRAIIHKPFIESLVSHR